MDKDYNSEGKAIPFITYNSFNQSNNLIIL